jgi:hypothetical protein
MHTRERQVLRDVLGRMGEHAPPPVPFEELDMVEARPQTRHQPRIWAVGIACLATLLVGGAIVWANVVSAPSSDRHVGNSDELVLVENPLVVLGNQSPEPLFDTSALGTEAPLADPVNVENTVNRVADNLLETVDMDKLIRFVVAGSTPSGATAGLVQTSSGLHWCLWLTPAGATERPTCSGRRSTDTSPVINYNPVSDSDWAKGTVAWGPLPEATSVVAIVYGNEACWQQPIGGIAVFDVTNPEQDQVVMTAYDRNGDTIETVTGPGTEVDS